MSPTLKTLTAAVLLANLPAAAQAMPYSQLVIFGDSLSDSGQFPDLGSPCWAATPPAACASPTAPALPS